MAQKEQCARLHQRQPEPDALGLRVFHEEACHLAARIRSTRVRVGASGTAASPSMRRTVDGPLLDHHASVRVSPRDAPVGVTVRHLTLLGP